VDSQTVSQALAGGALIGLAATLLLLGTGRIAGVSGIARGLIIFRRSDYAWRLAFVVGLVAGGYAFYLLRPEAFEIGINRPLWAYAFAGLMVGFGSALAHGCTSGHGVCGVSRLSARSLLATALFIVSGMLTVWALGG